MHDPEKFSAHAQSGKALELMNEPMVDLIDEKRVFLEKFMVAATLKIMAMHIFYNNQGMITDVPVSPTFQPKSLDITVDWQPVFPLTTDDLQKTVNLYTSLTNANIMSRQTALEKLSKYFDIEDIEREIQIVNTQQQFNTWGF